MDNFCSSTNVEKRCIQILQDMFHRRTLGRVNKTKVSLRTFIFTVNHFYFYFKMKTYQWFSLSCFCISNLPLIDVTASRRGYLFFCLHINMKRCRLDSAPDVSARGYPRGHRYTPRAHLSHTLLPSSVQARASE